MNRLNNMKAYLAGPMDNVPDIGSDWRNYIKEKLWDFGVEVLCPVNKPIQSGLETPEIRDSLISLKQSRKYDAVSNAMKEIASVDLDMVNLSNFLVVNLDLQYYSCGTFFEIAKAVDQHKPVLIHCPQGKENIPNFLFGMTPHEMFFSSWVDLMNYLTYINGEQIVNTLGKWRFFDYSKTRSPVGGDPQLPPGFLDTNQ